MGKREKSAELGSSRAKKMRCCVIAECSFWRKRLIILQKEQQMVISKPQGRNASQAIS